MEYFYTTPDRQYKIGFISKPRYMNYTNSSKFICTMNVYDNFTNRLICRINGNEKEMLLFLDGLNEFILNEYNIISDIFTFGVSETMDEYSIIMIQDDYKNLEDVSPLEEEFLKIIFRKNNIEMLSFSISYNESEEFIYTGWQSLESIDGVTRCISSNLVDYFVNGY